MSIPYKAAGPWYKWRDEKWVSEYKSGMSAYEIAMEWHYHVDTVNKVLKHYGVR